MPRRHEDTQTWESIPDYRLDRFPRQTHRNLETWISDADRTIERRAAAEKRPLEIDDVRALVGPFVGDDVGQVELQVIGALALSLWGAEHVEAAREKRRKANGTPFAGVNGAIAFMICGEVELGTAPTRILKTEDDGAPSWTGASSRHDRGAERAEEEAAKKRKGYIPGVKASAHRVKGAGMGELRADVSKAIRASGVGPIDLWLVEATSYGTTIGLATVAGKASVATLKWPASQGGQKGKVATLTRKDAAEALRRMAGVEPTEEGASDEAIAQRIARARKAIAVALVTRGLIPEEKQPTKRAADRLTKPKRAPLQPFTVPGGI